MSILPYLYSTPHSESVQPVQISGWSSSTYWAHPQQKPYDSSVFSYHHLILFFSEHELVCVERDGHYGGVLASGTAHRTAPDHIRYTYISHPQVISNGCRIIPMARQHRSLSHGTLIPSLTLPAPANCPQYRGCLLGPERVLVCRGINESRVSCI